MEVPFDTMNTLKFHGYDGIPAREFSWTLPLTEEEVQEAPMKARREPTEAEEVWNLVQEFYKAQGRSIPAADATACLKAINEEKKPKTPPPEREKTVEDHLGPRPMWGDPLFWEYWRKAKALGFTNEKKKKSQK